MEIVLQGLTANKPKHLDDVEVTECGRGLVCKEPIKMASMYANMKEKLLPKQNESKDK